jgi:hypothetical protein
VGTVAIAVSDPAQSSGSEGAWRERPERPRARRHRPAWRHAAAALLGIAYAAALAATSWYGSIDSDDGGAGAPLTAVVTVLAWGAVTVLLGYVLRRWAFAIIALAVVVPAWIGEAGEEFDNELRYFNWLLLIVLNAALVAPGAWLGRRRP